MKTVTPVQVSTQKEAKKRLRELAGKTDLAELWLDHIRDLDIADLLKNKPLPVICVCKKPIEKGRFKGTYKEAISLLKQAALHGADYVDLPYQILKKSPLTRGLGVFPLLNKEGCPKGGVVLNKKQTTKISPHWGGPRIIVSYHHFTKTPESRELLQKAIDMKRAGADIVKIACMARKMEDTIRLINLAHRLRQKGIPHILIAMGRKGALSRVLTPTLGGTFMFAPLTRTRSSAPGQLTVGELKSAWRLLKN